MDHFPQTSNATALPLEAHHINDLSRSGLSNETISMAGIHSITREEGRAILGFDPGAPSMAFPYPRRGPLPDLIRVKPDIPYRYSDGREAKYLSPKGSTNRLYIPPEELLPMERLQARSRPLLITEGEKKCLKAVQEELVCIGLSGVWSWKFRDQMNDSRTLPDFGTIYLKEREVYLVFDSDFQQKWSVRQAAFKLGEKLRELGASSVELIRLPSGPDGEKVGLDDYLVSHTTEQLWQLPKVVLDAPSEITVEDWLADANRGDVEEILPALAKLSPLEYEKIRERVAEIAAVRVSVLDDETEALRAKSGKPSGSVKTVAFPDVEPYPAPVDGAVLLDEIAIWYRRYVVLPDGAADAQAVWAVATWFRKELYFAPILAIQSPAMRSGKTTNLDLLRLTCYRGHLTSGAAVTMAILFRLNELYHPTLLIDEGEKLSGIDQDQKELIGLLNSGHRKGATVQRCVGDNHDVAVFDAHGWRSIATIGSISPTLMDRSIVIPMKRKDPSQKVERFDARKVESEGGVLARKIARWVADNRGRVADCDGKTPRPAWLDDRACDNWGALFAVGTVVGCGWLDRLMTAAKELKPTERMEDLGTRLLFDIKSIFEERGEAWIKSETLRECLNEIETSQWGDWGKGRGLSTKKLAAMLKPFGIVPCHMEDGNGYRRGDFEDAFGRYTFIPPPSEGGFNPSDPSGANEINVLGRFQSFSHASPNKCDPSADNNATSNVYASPEGSEGLERDVERGEDIIEGGDL